MDQRTRSPARIAPLPAVVGCISVFGFLNRWNDTLATPLEREPIDVGEKFLAKRGWSPGKHTGQFAHDLV